MITNNVKNRVALPIFIMIPPICWSISGDIFQIVLDLVYHSYRGSLENVIAAKAIICATSMPFEGDSLIEGVPAYYS